MHLLHVIALHVTGLNGILHVIFLWATSTARCCVEASTHHHTAKTQHLTICCWLAVIERLSLD
jgi:hypothetical protein